MYFRMFFYKLQNFIPFEVTYFKGYEVLWKYSTVRLTLACQKIVWTSVPNNTPTDMITPWRYTATNTWVFQFMFVQTRFTQRCFFTFGPPNLVLSRQFLHFPHSSLLQFAHLPHALRRLRREAILSTSSWLKYASRPSNVHWKIGASSTARITWVACSFCRRHRASQLLLLAHRFDNRSLPPQEQISSIQ